MDCLSGKNLVRIFVRVETSKRTTGTKNRLSDKWPIVNFVFPRKLLRPHNKAIKILSVGQGFGQLFGQEKHYNPDKNSLGACFVFVAGKTNVARPRANALPLAMAGYTTSALWRAAKGQRNWPLVPGEPLASPWQTSLLKDNLRRRAFWHAGASGNLCLLASLLKKEIPDVRRNRDGDSADNCERMRLHWRESRSV